MVKSKSIKKLKCKITVSNSRAIKNKIIKEAENYAVKCFQKTNINPVIIAESLDFNKDYNEISTYYNILHEVSSILNMHKNTTGSLGEINIDFY